MKLMPIAILDPVSLLTLKDLQDIARENGVTNLVENLHLTMATYELPDTEIKRYLQEVKGKLSDMEQFTVNYSEIVYMRDWKTVNCNPVKDASLMQAYRRIASVMPEYLHDYYRTEEVFLPHTTMIGRTEHDITTAVERMRESFTPFSAKAVRLDFSVEVSEKEYDIVHSIDLKEAF